MKVVCVESFGSFITEGCTYTVVEQNGDLLKVIDNTGAERYFNKSNFSKPAVSKSEAKRQASGYGSNTYMHESRQDSTNNSVSVLDVILISQMMQPSQVQVKHEPEFVRTPEPVVESPSYVREPEPTYEPETRRSDSWFTPSSYDSGSPSSYDSGGSYDSGSSWD